MVRHTRSDDGAVGAPTRRRPVWRALKYLTATAVVGTGATVGVVLLLNQLTGTGPVTERCAGVLDGTDWYLSPAQADNAALITGTAVRRGLPARAGTIALATALQESKLINIDHGHADSLGLFQQRPSQGWGGRDQVRDPVYSTNAFYDGLVEVEGYTEMAVTVAAQEVQRSAYPDAYAGHEMRARAWASGLTGHAPASLTCELAPVEEETAQDAATARGVVAERLGRDLGLEPAGSSGGAGVTVDATPLVPDDAGRAGWATAQWAVATAAATDTTEVRVADQVWTRESAEWTTADPALPPGEVRITPVTAG